MLALDRGPFQVPASFMEIPDKKAENLLSLVESLQVSKNKRKELFMVTT